MRTMHKICFCICGDSDLVSQLSSDWFQLSGQSQLLVSISIYGLTMFIISPSLSSFHLATCLHRSCE